MKRVPVEQAVGMVLCHDITRIAPGEFKGRAFAKGHIIREEDVPVLLNLGKQNIYVWEMTPGTVHEDDAARQLAQAAAGDGLEFGEPREGKVDIKANCDGLLKVDAEAIMRLNSVGEVVIATLHNHTRVKPGQVVAGTRVIPLVVDQRQIDEAERICASDPPLRVLPFRSLMAGLIVTGSEVYRGRIQDRFGPVVKDKLARVNCPVVWEAKSLDDPDMIAGLIREMHDAGAEMIVVSGGMSVDPDDATPGGIRRAGTQVVTYGTPVLPGSMFMLAYLGNVPVMGLPGCVMYDKVTVFDLVLPRILAGERLTKQDFVVMGHGGLCMKCEVCHYPVCPLGK